MNKTVIAMFAGVMSNAGLAENGDARIYFGKDVDTDQQATLTDNPVQGLCGKLKIGSGLQVHRMESLCKVVEFDMPLAFQDVIRFGTDRMQMRTARALSIWSRALLIHLHTGHAQSADQATLTMG